MNLIRKLLAIDLIRDLFRKDSDRAKKLKEHIKPFSWQVALLLSLFSWFTFLLIRDPGIKQFVSLVGWFFLIVGVDWWLLKEEFTLPGIGLKFRYGAWITGALAVCALWSNGWLIQDSETALTTWPLLSVIFATLPRFLRPEFKIQSPSSETRRDLVIVILLGILLSCWLRFHFLLQHYLHNYPSIAADNISHSAFVVRLNPHSVPSTSGVKILNAAEATVRNELAKRSWNDGQRWLVDISTQAPLLKSQSIITAYQEAPELREQDLWEFKTQYSRSIPTNRLQLETTWTGASSQGEGYSLRKVCDISEPPIQQFVSGTVPAPATPVLPVSYRMECYPIESSTPNVNIKQPEPIIQQTGNFLDRLLSAIVSLFEGIVNGLGRILGADRGQGL